MTGYNARTTATGVAQFGSDRAPYAALKRFGAS
jgi:hypothetical protein